jgi:hypothetical protein
MLCLLLASTVSAQDVISTDSSVANDPASPIEDHMTATFHGSNTVATINDLGLPPAADLSALHLIDATTLLFTLKSAAQLGPVSAHAGDILRWEDGIITLEIPATVLGLGPATGIDALFINGDSLVFSVDIASVVNGLAVTDSDLLSWTPAGGVALWIGQDVCGIPHENDLTGAHLLADGDLLLAFASASQVGGTTLRKGDIARCDPSDGSVVTHRRFSDLGPQWAAIAIDAVSQFVLEQIFKDSFETPTP